jgi:phenylpyruvate tautomerase PptA (4-oxalocrotonate tautomerase family)
MPLWTIYHTPNAFTVEQKAELAERITTLCYPPLPAFYVGVAFHEMSPDNLYIGGKPADKFVRIAVDHIARTLPEAAQRAGWLDRARQALVPLFTERGLSWEMHIDETTRDLWLIQGLVPPMPNTEPEKKWKAENMPSPY